jgi:hypothetical protein
MEHHQKLLKKSSASKVDATKYRSLVGCLRYLVHTQLDIVCTISYVS